MGQTLPFCSGWGFCGHVTCHFFDLSWAEGNKYSAKTELYPLLKSTAVASFAALKIILYGWSCHLESPAKQFSCLIYTSPLLLGRKEGIFKFLVWFGLVYCVFMFFEKSTSKGMKLSRFRQNWDAEYFFFLSLFLLPLFKKEEKSLQSYSLLVGKEALNNLVAVASFHIPMRAA